MKKFKNVILILVIIISVNIPAFSQKSVEVIGLEKDSGSETDVENPTQNSNSDLTDSDRVSVFTLINQGPLGELYYSADAFGGLLKENFKKADIESPYIYPSLYFDISTSPKFSLDKGKIKNKDYDLKWMDVEVTLYKICNENRKKKEPCTLWLVDLYPNETDSGTKDHPLITGVGIAEELAKLTDPFFLSGAGKVLNAKIGAGTNGLSVLFKNLLPPIVKTYFHPRIIGGRRFGWTFRENRDSKNPSLLGLQRGLVFLQAGKGLDKIQVKYKIKTLWNKKVSNTTGKIAEFERTYTIDIPNLTVPAKIDYTKLNTLKDFPALIKMSEVCSIFSIEEKYCLTKTTFDRLKQTLQAGDNNLLIAFPNAVNSDEEAKTVLFKRAVLQAYLGIDQEK